MINHVRPPGGGKTRQQGTGPHVGGGSRVEGRGDRADRGETLERRGRGKCAVVPIVRGHEAPQEEVHERAFGGTPLMPTQGTARLLRGRQPGVDPAGELAGLGH